MLKAALGRAAEAGAGFEALPAVTHDDIDDAAHRVGAIERRGAIQQDVDPLHCRQRQARDVGEIGHDARARHATAVDQDKGRVGAETPKIDACGAAGVGPGGVRADGAGPVAGCAREGLGQGGHGVADGREPATINGRAADVDHGRGGVADAADVRADDDFRNRDRLLDGGYRAGDRVGGGRNRRCAYGRARRAQRQHAWADLVDDDLVARDEVFDRLANGEPSLQRRRAKSRHQFGREKDLHIGLCRQRDE